MPIALSLLLVLFFLLMNASSSLPSSRSCAYASRKSKSSWTRVARAPSTPSSSPTTSTPTCQPASWASPLPRSPSAGWASLRCQPCSNRCSRHSTCPRRPRTASPSSSVSSSSPRCTSCILIPYRCENKVLMATIVAALVNIGLNFILIPTFQQNAAAFTTVIAELLSMVITWWYGRKYFRVSFLKKDILSVAIGCLAIWTICSISEKYISSVLISTVFSVTASVVIYMIVLLIMKNQAVKLVLEILHIKK